MMIIGARYWAVTWDSLWHNRQQGQAGTIIVAMLSFVFELKGWFRSWQPPLQTSALWAGGEETLRYHGQENCAQIHRKYTVQLRSLRNSWPGGEGGKRGVQFLQFSMGLSQRNMIWVKAWSYLYSLHGVAWGDTGWDLWLLSFYPTALLNSIPCTFRANHST